MALALLAIAGCASTSEGKRNSGSYTSLDLAKYQSASPKPKADLRVFFGGQTRGALSLSPDGKHVAYIQREERGGGVYLLDTTTKDTIRIGDGGRGTKFLWAADSSGFFVDARESILFYDLKTSAFSAILRKPQNVEIEALQAHPVDLSLFIRAQSHDKTTISLIGTDGSEKKILQSDFPITGQAFSPSGRLSYVKQVIDEAQTVFLVSDDGVEEIMECDAIDVCELVTSDRDGRLVMMSDLGGDLRGLVTLDPDADRISARIVDPRGIGDLVSLEWDDDRQAPLFLGFAHSPGGYVFGDTRLNEILYNEIEKLDLMTVEFQGDTSSQTYLLSVGDASMAAPDYYYVNVGEARVEKLFQEASSNAQEQLPFLPKTPFSYAASDGLVIHGYLTIPPGRDLSITPIVVRVHGGPWARSRNEYDPIVQIWANRGYVVFEPNFRGSTGYGRAFRAAAEADFGLDGRVHQDIVDGVIALRKLGIGVDAPAAITGHSFGGYAAYVGLVRSSDLFSVAISESGPADIGPSLLAAASGEDPNTKLPRRNRLRLDGVDVESDEYFIRLGENSPRSSAEKIEGSVLMFGGGNDELVPSEDLKSYAEKLAALGTDVTFLLDPDSGHDLESPGMRQSYVFLTEAFLAQHLGGARSDSIPPPILAFVNRYTVVGDPNADWIAPE